jgi:sulfite exporter TauE/SafE
MLKAIAGGVSALAGVWTLADIPLVNPGPAIALGWVLIALGLAVLAPALLDLLDGEA